MSPLPASTSEDLHVLKPKLPMLLPASPLTHGGNSRYKDWLGVTFLVLSYHFLPFHPAVLIPSLHLQLSKSQRLGQVQSRRHETQKKGEEERQKTRDLGHAG